MREILFRGKRIDNDKFIEGNLILNTTNEPVIGKAFLCMKRVVPQTVCQFTGLTDCNGNKIFEGDIVHCVSMTDMANMVVIFEDGEFRMVLCEKYKDYIPGCGFYAIRCFDKEVIGNIHNNPELLENP